MTAPNFCMLLRKHLGGGRVLAVRQPSLERILEIQIEHRDEMGDLCQKALIIELMGKHSNIIFTDDSGRSCPASPISYRRPRKSSTLSQQMKMPLNLPYSQNPQSFQRQFIHP